MSRQKADRTFAAYAATQSTILAHNSGPTDLNCAVLVGNEITKKFGLFLNATLGGGTFVLQACQHIAIFLYLGSDWHHRQAGILVGQDFGSLSMAFSLRESASETVEGQGIKDRTSIA